MEKKKILKNNCSKINWQFRVLIEKETEDNNEKDKKTKKQEEKNKKNSRNKTAAECALKQYKRYAASPDMQLFRGEKLS